MPATTTPVLLTEGTAAKSVLIPNTALNASACAPVRGVAALAAVVAVAHVVFAVASAPQVLVRVLQMNEVMTAMLSADPWLNETMK